MSVRNIQNRWRIGRFFSCLAAVALLVFLITKSLVSEAGFVDHFARTDDIGPNKAPHNGFSRILVIPVNLDTKHRKKLDPEKIRRFFSDRGEDFSFPGFFRINSCGRLRLEAEISKPVNFEQCPIPLASEKCAPTRRDISSLLYGIPLVLEVIRRAKLENGLDFRRYDINGPSGKPDGWCDGIVILMNGGWFGVALPFGIFDRRFELEFDGVRINQAAISGGRRALAMSIHEYGHLLGFADLYDEWKRTAGLQLSAMGNWKYRSDSVPMLDAFSKMQIGWAEMERISGSRTVLIPPANTCKVYQLGTGPEFHLVENRGPIGVYDANTQQPGLAVYHVNLKRLPAGSRYSFVRTVADCPNCRRWRPLVMNVQADRLFDNQYRLKRFEPEDLFRTGDALLPSPSSLPLSDSNVWFSSNLYSGKGSGVAIEDIDSQSYLPFIRARLTAPVSDHPCKNLKCPGDLSCYGGRCRKPLFSDNQGDSARTTDQGPSPQPSEKLFSPRIGGSDVAW